MEEIITGFITIVSSIFLMCINRRYHSLSLIRTSLQGTDAFFLDFLFDTALYMCFINYLFPAVTHIFFDYSALYDEGVSPYELSVVYLVDTLSWVLFYKVVYEYAKRRKNKLRFSLQNTQTLEKIASVLLLIYLFSRLTTLGLQEDEPSVWEQRFFFIIPFVNLSGFMLAIFIVVVGKNYFSKKLWYLALVAMGAYFLGAFLGGIRGNIVTPIVWASYVAFKFLSQRERNKYLVISGVALLLFILIQPIFMSFRVLNKENLSISEKIEMAQKIASNKSLQETDSRYLVGNIFRELDYRYGAQGTYTVGFYRLVDKEGHVGFNCITNSFFTFIPSVLYGNNKPVSTSSDGTMDGMGMYKCVNAVNGSNNMCGFFTSGHAYWELGIVGIILFSIIPAIFDVWCINLFRRLDIIGIALYSSIFMKAFGEVKMWVSLIIVEFAQIILPLLILIYIYSVFVKRKMYIH